MYNVQLVIIVVSFMSILVSENNSKTIRSDYSNPQILDFNYFQTKSSNKQSLIWFLKTTTINISWHKLK